MQITVAKWGNSAAVRLPQQLLSEIAVVVGDQFKIRVEGNKIILEPAKRSLSLLLAQITPENKHEEMITTVEGKEVI